MSELNTVAERGSHNALGRIDRIQLGTMLASASRNPATSGPCLLVCLEIGAPLTLLILKVYWLEEVKVELCEKMPRTL